MAKRICKRGLIIEFLQLITGIRSRRVKKAAPRFELGIKDLQSSALPLGHAAERESDLSSSDRISCSAENLLVLCNGHGEDLIALRVLQALHKLRPSLSLEVLPLVGEGKVFELAIAEGWLRRIGPSVRLPSGGFSNQSLRALLADMSGGIFKLTWDQFICVCNAAGEGRVILAVGDFFPLLLAWISCTSFGFIGTPKSDYTWRSGPGRSISDFYHRLKGTEWDPWEYFLMCSPRCKMVAVRDSLTARGLRCHGVNAQSPGNPMMDGFNEGNCPDSLISYRRLLLLCGSRMPEAKYNLIRLLKGVTSLDTKLPLAIFIALGVEPEVNEVEEVLIDFGYKKCRINDSFIGSKACWEKDSHLILIGPGQFSKWATWVEVGLANAGTATEQLVGLGIPAVSLPGSGPQFKKSFALRQSRLLGGAVITCSNPEQLAEKLQVLLAKKDFRRKLGLIGAKRMGSAGGSASLANLVSCTLCMN